MFALRTVSVRSTSITSRHRVAFALSSLPSLAFGSPRRPALCNRHSPPPPPTPPSGRDRRPHGPGPGPRLPLASGFLALLCRAPRRPEQRARAFLLGLRISYILLALNVAVFLAQGATGGQLLLAGAKVNSEIAAGQLYRLFTPMFLHASVSHLAINCFSLYSTGPAVESWFGKQRFTSLYLAAGAAGNILSFLCTPTPSVGASGAIFGLVGATAVLLMRHRRILGPRSRRGLNSLAYIVVVNFGMGMSPASRVDNFGHLGGLIGGVLFAWLFGPRLVLGRDGRLVDVPLSKMLLNGVRDVTSPKGRKGKKTGMDSNFDNW